MIDNTEAMELWKSALDEYQRLFVRNRTVLDCDQAAASIIAAALKERDARIDAKDRALARIAASYVGWTSERVELLRAIARQALEADNAE